MTFSVGETKIGEKQSRQSNSKYNFMQYVFIKECICNIGSGAKPQQLENFRELCVKTVCQVTLNCKLQKKNWGSRMY